jgi:hypothetical protein
MLINELMQQRTTITLEVDCETLKKLPWPSRNKRHGMVKSGAVPLHDSVSAFSCSHTSAAGAFQLGVVWLLSLQPCSHSERLPPVHLAEELCRIETWLKSHRSDFLDRGIQKFIPRYDKCLNSGGDHFKKQLEYMHIYLIYRMFFIIAGFVNSPPEVTLRKVPVRCFSGYKRHSVVQINLSFEWNPKFNIIIKKAILNIFNAALIFKRLFDYISLSSSKIQHPWDCKRTVYMCPRCNKLKAINITTFYFTFVHLIKWPYLNNF